MGKKIRDEDLVLNIVVNGDRGKKEIGQLERAVRDTRKELELLQSEEKKMRAEGKKDTAQYKAVTEAIKQKNTAILTSQARMDQLKKGMKLAEKSVTDLKREMIQLRNMRDAATPHSAAWKKHDAQLQIVKAKYQQLTTQANITGNTIGRMTSRINRMLGSITAGIASFYAIAFGIRRATDEFVSFDDKVADVQKTTGLTHDEVLGLNESLKDIEVIDTRTSQENLLGLGRIAGKLGIEGRDNLLGFIKAADEISVALTEDLGGDVEQSINTIGKLVDVFDVDNEFGIEAGMRKVGSLINELGAESSASEEEIVDFMARLAGIGPSAGISIANVAGLGSTLSQLKQSMEVAGTTFTNVIPKMFTETAKFAEIAGMGVDEFKTLLETDANEALIRFMEGLRGNNEGMAYMMKLLQSLGLEGARAKNILSVMANNTAKLRNEQILANEAFDEGTSILEEFNVKNTNAAAELDKAKKGVNNMWIELGEKLYPVMLESVGLFERFLKTISILIDFVKQYRIIIISLTSAIIAYNIALKAQALWTNRATIAQRALNLAMKKNPVIWLVSGLIALGTALYLYSTRTKEATSAADEFNQMQQKANDSASDEESKIKSLLAIARDKSRLDTERNEAIKELIALSPEMLGSLSLETINTDNAADAVKRYIQFKKDQYLIDQLVAKQQELNQRKTGLIEGITQNEDRIEEVKGTRAAPSVTKAANQAIAAKQKELSEIEKLELANETKLNEIYDRQIKEKARISADAESERLRLERLNQEKNNAELTEKQIEDQEKFRQKVLLESQSLIAQEKAAHQDRLKQAGLFGKSREKMSREDLAILAALEKTHQANLSKIDADAISDEIERRDAAFQSDLNALRIRQNEELKSFRGTKEEHEKLIRDQYSEEEKLTEEYGQNLIAILQEVINSGDWEGITSDDILSDEEKAALEAKIEELKIKLSELGLKGKDNKADEDDTELGFGNTDILGFSQDDWALFLKNLQDGEDGIQGLIFAARAFTEAWKMHNDYVKQAEERQLQNYESNINSQKEALEEKLDRDLESAERNAGKQKEIREEYNKSIKKLDADLDKKKAEFAYNQAKRDKQTAIAGALVNSFAGAARAFADHAFPASAIIAGIVTGLGLYQVDKIASTPLPEIPGREDGGFMDVVRSQDRRLFRARYRPDHRGYVDQPTVITGESGRELVASNKAYNNPTIRPALDVIDTAQRNGTISTVNLMKVLQDRPPVRMSGREDGGFIDYPSSGSPSGTGGNTSSAPTTDPELKALIYDLRRELRKGIKATVSLLGKGGFNEAQEELDEINNNVNF